MSRRSTPVSQPRILHMMPHVENRGNGLVNVGVDMAYVQAKAGYAVTVAAEDGAYRPMLEAAGVTFIEFPHVRGFASLLASPLRFRRILAAARPDVIHTHVLTGTLLASLFRFGAVYRLVASVHTEFKKTTTLMGLADRIISISEANARQLEKRGIARSKITIIKNAPLESPRTIEDAPEAPPQLVRPSITTIAGLSFRKGIDVLLAAFERVHARVPGAELYIVGAGPDRAAFLTQAESLAARPQIHFVGFKPHPQAYLAQTDIFVLASRREPFGLAIIEARAAGCAIVASDVDGIPEAVAAGRAGILVPPDDADALAGALVSLLTDENELARWKSAATRELGDFSVERLLRETLAVYALP